MIEIYNQIKYFVEDIADKDYYLKKTINVDYKNKIRNLNNVLKNIDTKNSEVHYNITGRLTLNSFHEIEFIGIENESDYYSEIIRSEWSNL